jgi:hypothetical protein
MYSIVPRQAVMAYVWLTRHQEAAVGVWNPIPDPPYWKYDEDAPDADPTVTQMLPVVGYQPADVDPNVMPPEDQHQHGGDE